MQNVARIVPWGDIVSEHFYSVERRLDLTLDHILSDLRLAHCNARLHVQALSTCQC